MNWETPTSIGRTTLDLARSIPARLRPRVSHFTLVRGSEVHPTVAIKSGTRIHQSTIDRYSYTGRGCLVMGTTIGSFCSIADGCFIGSAQHDLESASTSPVFQGDGSILGEAFGHNGFPPLSQTRLGHDVWVGNRAIVLGGVTVGTGAVIGAGAVVTRDVEPYTIVAGNPARPIRRRFEAATAEALLASRWWELPVEDLRRIGPSSSDPVSFVDAVKHITGS